MSGATQGHDDHHATLHDDAPESHHEDAHGGDIGGREREGKPASGRVGLGEERLGSGHIPPDQGDPR